MSTWKRIHEQATGALPVGTLTKWGVVLVSLLLAAFILVVSVPVQHYAPEEEDSQSRQEWNCRPDRARKRR